MHRRIFPASETRTILRRTVSLARWRGKRLAVVVCLLSSTALTSTRAGTLTWAPQGSSTDWATAGNLQDGTGGASNAAPGGGDDVTINATGVTVTTKGNQVSTITVGNGQASSLTISNGADISSRYSADPAVIIAAQVGSSASITIDGPGSKLTILNAIEVGDLGIGQFNILHGGVFSSGNGTIGANLGASGAVTISGGSTWTSTGSIQVVNTGPAPSKSLTARRSMGWCGSG